VENVQRVLMRLSGNVSSALTNADGSPNPALLSGGVTAIRDAEVTLPANILLTVQLLEEYDLHPKKIAWLMQVRWAAAAHSGTDARLPQPATSAGCAANV
jgi:hypothetical protein